MVYKQGAPGDPVPGDAADDVNAPMFPLGDDLKLQVVWDDMWGLVQVVFLPDNKVLTVHKTGELKVHENVFAKAEVNRSQVLPWERKALRSDLGKHNDNRTLS